MSEVKVVSQVVVFARKEANMIENEGIQAPRTVTVTLTHVSSPAS